LDKQACETETKGNFMSWFEKAKSKKLTYSEKEPKVAADPVICPDNSTCDPLKTCCRLSFGSYGCCPYSDGVCCPEINYCCPGNSRCGFKYGECLPVNQMKVFQLNWHTIEDKAQIMNKKIENRDSCSISDTKC
jgi:hypothetical protein